jgi:hypothetical protein
MRDRDHILLEKAYDDMHDKEWDDVEEMLVDSFMTSGAGHPPIFNFKEMLNKGYNYYYPYFSALSFHEGLANVAFIRSKDRPTKDIELNYRTISPEDLIPLSNEKTFKRDLEKVYDKLNEWEMKAIEMDNPRVKGWG